MDIFKLGDKILALLEAVFGFWNNQISLVFAMLGQSPVSFKGGGPRFSIKTTYAIFMLTFLLWLFQLIVNNYIVAPDMTPDGKPLLLGPGQDFMACIIGAAMCGVGLGITFNYNGSTGGTDIIAAIVNKYKDVSLGRMIMICDVVIISSCYFIFHDWRRVIFGFVTLFIIGVVLDWIINSARQSVQFLIFSKKYDEIADHKIGRASCRERV